MIFLGIAIPIGILLGLLLFFSGLYNRNRLAAAASGGLDMFTTNFENQLDSVENYLLNLSLNDATFRSLSEQTDRTRAYLDACEIAQGFPAVLAANDALMGVVLLRQPICGALRCNCPAAQAETESGSVSRPAGPDQ